MKIISRVLTKKPSLGLIDFLDQCEQIDSVDTQRVYQLAQKTISFLRASKSERQTLADMRALEKRWYHSLNDPEPDWNVYDTDEYLAELWACWIVYSRQYLRAIIKSRSLPESGGIVNDLKTMPISGIADLGCGIGFTTAALTEIFPAVTVSGTNLDNMKQTRIARRMGSDYGFSVFATIHEINHPVDLVFASEYFEHIPDPVDHLIDVLRVLKPKALLIANTFNAASVGHFDYYHVNGARLTGRKTSLIFNQTLRRLGYEKVDANLWNNRPAYWRKTND